MKKKMKSQQILKYGKKAFALFCSLIIFATLVAGCAAIGQQSEASGDQTAASYPEVVRIGSLKGPTTLGMLYMMNQDNEASDAEAKESTNEDAGLKENANDDTETATKNNYEFQMMTAADELLPLMIKGELDIALIPANVASILYAKMEGNLCVIDVNTLGVLYMVSGNAEIETLKDLEGQTVYLTGKGTTPDYVLRYLLTQAGVDIEKVNLEFKAEATEVAAMLAERPEAVGLLPQPFVTAALAQNDKLSVVMDLTAQWDMLQENVNDSLGMPDGEVKTPDEAGKANSSENVSNGSTQGSRLVTGVTVVRKAFLEQYPEAVAQFLRDHAASADYVNSNVDQAAAWAVEQGIIAKEPLAKKAIPQCNIVCIQGQEMKEALSGYLQVLFEQSKEAVGGSLPAEDFYFVE